MYNAETRSKLSKGIAIFLGGPRRNLQHALASGSLSRKDPLTFRFVRRVCLRVVIFKLAPSSIIHPSGRTLQTIDDGRWTIETTFYRRSGKVNTYNA